MPGRTPTQDSGIRRKPSTKHRDISCLYNRLSANAFTLWARLPGMPCATATPSRVHTGLRCLQTSLPDVIFLITHVGRLLSIYAVYRVAYAASCRMPPRDWLPTGMPSLRSCIPGYGVAGFLGGSHLLENVDVRRIIAAQNRRAMCFVGIRFTAGIYISHLPDSMQTWTDAIGKMIVGFYC